MELKAGMYVRVPFEEGRHSHYREFFVGKLTNIDDFGVMSFSFYDLDNLSIYYRDVAEAVREGTTYSGDPVWLDHAKLAKGSAVVTTQGKGKVLAFLGEQNGFYAYEIQLENDQEIECSELHILMAGLTSGLVSPLSQFARYEFQNPAFLPGKAATLRASKSIDKYLYGFSELASAKIYLQPYQIKTVKRCLQSLPCRYMIADEVGMGKTIEAIACLKVYLADHRKANVIIVVPDALRDQWKNELGFKFRLFETGNNDRSSVSFSLKLCKFSDLVSLPEAHYDFAIVDEIHRLLNDDRLYDRVLTLSKNTTNILMLSATPIQELATEYKRLLTLVIPEKYGKMSEGDFNALVSLKTELSKQLSKADRHLGICEDDMAASDPDEELIAEDFENVRSDLTAIKESINDEEYNSLIKKAEVEDRNASLKTMKDAIAFVNENYHFESHVIRNRRSSAERHPERLLKKSFYSIGHGKFNQNEAECFNLFGEWFGTMNKEDPAFFERDGLPLAQCLLSSGHAFYARLKRTKGEVPANLLSAAKKWYELEEQIIEDPMSFIDECDDGNSCRPLEVISELDNHADGADAKCILFTSNSDTFNFYKRLLQAYFDEESVCLFQKGMSEYDLGLNVFRFQSFHDRYYYLLSDSSGGEGHNFQSASYIIHIDVPWNPSELEQRIGRLDRIGRPAERPVLSVVVGTNDTMEENLVDIYEKAFPIFLHAQTGMEIIISEIEKTISDALRDDFYFGLKESMSQISEQIEGLSKKVQRELRYDTTRFTYSSLDKLVRNNLEKFDKNGAALFSEAFMLWSSLVGFDRKVYAKTDDKILSLTRASFSVNAANKLYYQPSLLNGLFDDELVKLANKYRGNDKTSKTYSILGTYDRATAVANDYIHLFAPGDVLYDSVIDNGIGSFKGQTAAFQVKSDFEFSGIVYLFSLEIDEALPYKKNLAQRLVNEYKAFLPFDVLYSDVEPTLGTDSVNCENCGKLFKLLASQRYLLDHKTAYKNFGERGNMAVIQFEGRFPKDVWNGFINRTYSRALLKAQAGFTKSIESGIQQASQEIDRVVRLNSSISNYFRGSSDATYLQTKKDDILEVLKSASPVLKGVYYLEVINGRNKE